jgi:hypothetical protein
MKIPPNKQNLEKKSAKSNSDGEKILNQEKEIQSLNQMLTILE